MRQIPFRSLFLALVVFLGLSPALMPTAARAQDDPTAAEQRTTMREAGFPTATDIGSGWTQGYAYSLEASDDFAFDRHAVTYSDRFGNRIQLYAIMFNGKDGDAAYEAVAERVTNDNSVLFPSETAPSAREIRSLDDPEGCSAVDRALGEEPVMYFYVGTMSCLDEENGRALWVAVSGIYDGLVFQEATEAVLDVVLDTTPR